MILERIVQRVVYASVEAGEALPLTQARGVAAQYQMPVTFDFNQDKFIVHPNGEVRRIIDGLMLAAEPYGLTGENDEQPAEPLTIPEEFTVPKTIVKCWVFASSSGSGTYETLLYADGSTSCRCRGWINRVAPDGSRSCRHTRSVDMGRADSEAINVHDYSTGVPALFSTTPLEPKTTTRKEPNAKKKSGSGSQRPAGYGKRRLIL